MLGKRAKWEKDIVSIIFLTLSIIFYLFFAFYDGYFLFNDSDSYISMIFGREPVYPLVLAFFRLLKKESYLLYAVVFQSLLIAVAGWKLADYLRKRLEIHPAYSTVLYMLPIMVSLLNRFAAKRGSMYSNSIMSEGIAIPLYLLFIYFLLKYMFEESRGALLSAGFFSFILISTRKQMVVTLVLLVCVILWKGIRKAKLGEAFLRVLAYVVVILCAVRLFDCSYNYILRGEFTSHSSDNRFLTTMVFYNAELEDAEYIEDEEVRELFIEIYNVCDEKGYIASHAGEGWMNEVSHFGDNYDLIQINTMCPMIIERAKENLNSDDPTLYEKETDRINSAIIWDVLPHQIPELFKSLVNNFLSGLVTTVARITPVLNVYSAVMYVIYILLWIRLLKYVVSNKNANGIKGKEATLEFAGVTVLGIIFNVTLVSLVIFCQTRYTIYNMSLFYMSGAVLLYHNILLKKNTK